MVPAADAAAATASCVGCRGVVTAPGDGLCQRRAARPQRSRPALDLLRDDRRGPDGRTQLTGAGGGHRRNPDGGGRGAAARGPARRDGSAAGCRNQMIPSSEKRAAVENEAEK